MFLALAHRLGLRSWHFHSASIGGIVLCLGLWVRAKTVSQEARGNAERRALFVGLWPPTLWLVGDSLDRYRRQEVRGASRARRLLKRGG